MSTSNILVTATHASYFIPDFLQSRLALDQRLLMNFSDFATRYLVEDIPHSICCFFSRAIGNPNQSLDSDILFREFDFNNIPVWTDPPTEEEKEFLLENFYKKYHKSILEEINTLKPNLLVDVHDTGIWLLGKTLDQDTQRAFPEVCLSNGEGVTCPNEFLYLMGDLFKKHLDLSCAFNDPFQGGGVCRNYANKVKTIQVEFNRSLYMDERTQVIDTKKMIRIKDGFLKVLEDMNRL